MSTPSDATALRTLATRLERLERQNRWYRWSLGIVLAAALVLSPAVIDQAFAGKKSDTITAKRLALMDDNGKVRVLASSGKDGGGPSITLFDAAQKPSLTISNKKFPLIALHKASGAVVATLSSPKGKGGHLVLHGPKGKRITHQIPK